MRKTVTHPAGLKCYPSCRLHREGGGDRPERSASGVEGVRAVMLCGCILGRRYAALRALRSGRSGLGIPRARQASRAVMTGLGGAMLSAGQVLAAQPSTRPKGAQCHYARTRPCRGAVAGESGTRRGEKSQLPVWIAVAPTRRRQAGARVTTSAAGWAGSSGGGTFGHCCSGLRARARCRPAGRRAATQAARRRRAPRRHRRPAG